MYYVFTFYDYYPSGGMNDYDGKFETLVEAREYIQRMDPENWQIVKLDDSGGLGVVDRGYHG